MISYKTYKCNHPYYLCCTLYFQDDLGLAVIQQRFNDHWKVTWWDCIDNKIANDILENELFEEYFMKHAGKAENGLYPTVEVRKLLWAIRIKTPPKDIWETRF